MRVAIHRNDNIFRHSTSWSYEWERLCISNGIEYDIVNCFDNDILDKINKYDYVFWHFNNYSYTEMNFSRTILNCFDLMGVKTFPNYNSRWHFDDKIAEMYTLNSVGAPIPESFVFYTYDDVIKWLKTTPEFPVVAKLKCGSGSNNVRLLNNSKQIKRYAKTMFGRGYKSAPNLLFKTASNVRSSKDWEMFIKRFKRIPDFLGVLKKSKVFPKEHEYCYFQEYIPNEGFDLKIVVVGDKLSYIVREVRKGDFRASGGGSLSYDINLVSESVIKSAFETSDKLGFGCMGYDYVINSETGEGKIVEMSYGFSYTALMQAKGYWDRDLVWHNEPLNVPKELLEKSLHLDII